MCVILLFGWTVCAQSEISVTTSSRVVGRNYLTNKEIFADEIVFPDEVYHTYFDTLSGLLTVQLRGTHNNGKYYDGSGKLIVYDLANNRGKWSKYINYTKSEITQHNHLLIQATNNRYYSLNPETGEEQWEVKNTIFYSDPYQLVGMGYKIRNSYLDTHILDRIDLQNGNLLWKREINYDYGWNDVFHLSDSTIVIASSGLHMVNVKDGSGWDYNTVTGYKNYSQVVRDIVSNVLVDSLNLYMASIDKLTRLNHQGKVIWSTPLPNKLTSKSSIFIKDSVLYLLNKGWAYNFYRRIDVGKAFIAAYDLKTGKQLFLTPTKGKKDEINAIKIKNDNLLLVFKDRLSTYSLKDGSLLKEKEFYPYLDGELKYPIGSQVYMKTDSAYQSLTLSDTTKYYIYTAKEKILVLNDQLEAVEKLEFKDYYLYKGKEKEYKFLVKDKKTIVIDQNNKVIAGIDISNLTNRIGNKLYYTQEKSFIEVNIDDLINNVVPKKEVISN